MMIRFYVGTLCHASLQQPNFKYNTKSHGNSSFLIIETLTFYNIYNDAKKSINETEKGQTAKVMV
jgi:hypothetical protein